MVTDMITDLYNEVFEIIDSCTFSAKAISPTMWQAFILMHKTFKSGAELYLEGKLKIRDVHQKLITLIQICCPP
jgi:hypothetical protein